MKREVEVYNTHFGDCIVLRDKEKGRNLLVDFGIHYNSVINYNPYYGNREALTADIAEDIARRYSHRQLSLLITHFHEDHVSGLIYMYKSKDKRYKNLFSNIYIANIWNNPFAIALSFFEQMILLYEFYKSELPRTKYSLLDLVGFLCENISFVHFLSRGETFEDNRYITLWPLKDDSKNYFDKVKRDFKNLGKFEETLISLSKSVCDLVNECIATQEKFDSRMVTYIENRIERMKGEYLSLQNESYILFRGFEEKWLIEKRKKLNKFNHRYNIVFHNNIDDGENVLFTGDMECSQMKYIEKHLDIALHKKYKYIKIPHHGTEKHKIDFSKYTPENIIITNGKVNIGNVKSYQIDNMYGKLNARHVCTNSNNCKNCKYKCTTSSMICCKRGDRILVFNKLYMKI